MQQALHSQPSVRSDGLSLSRTRKKLFHVRINIDTSLLEWFQLFLHHLLKYEEQ